MAHNQRQRMGHQFQFMNRKLGGLLPSGQKTTTYQRLCDLATIGKKPKKDSSFVGSCSMLVPVHGQLHLLWQSWTSYTVEAAAAGSSLLTGAGGGSCGKSQATVWDEASAKHCAQEECWVHSDSLYRKQLKDGAVEKKGWACASEAMARRAK
ncbi:MAG: hypothetical protein FRX49_11472 [Trebouxia sp. A1-2]|nr:MAG: hypothetical protein FRX49_11472 [Trebouxia sp. A1-2]